MKIISHLDQHVFPAAVIPPVQIHHGVGCRARTGEIIENDGIRTTTRGSQTIFNQTNGLGKVEVFRSKDIFEPLRPEIRRSIFAIVPPGPWHCVRIHTYLEVYAYSAVATRRISTAPYSILGRDSLDELVATMPAFLDDASLFHSCGPNRCLITSRFFQNIIRLFSGVPFHYRDAKRVVVVDVNGIEHLGAVFPSIP